MNDNNWGCLNASIVMIIVAFIIGNIILFSGGFSDLENEEAYFVAIAVIGDCGIVSLIFSYIKERFSNTQTIVKDKIEPSKKERDEIFVKEIKDKIEPSRKERDEIFIKDIKDKISQKKDIIHCVNKNFEKIERDHSLVKLILNCMENKNKELEKLFNSNKEIAFRNMKKEIFYILPDSEKKRFPKSIVGIENYRNILSEEISGLERKLNSLNNY